jgi:hypothetical protein
MKTHHIKSWPQYFEATLSGAKPFDLRKNDRDYQLGDLVVLQEWSPETQTYTGRETTRQITYVLSGGDTGWAEGDEIIRRGLHTTYVILGYGRQPFDAPAGQ